MKKSRKIKIGSRWIFKHANKKLIVKVFEVEKGSVSYGVLKSVAGHISQSIQGFLQNYEREKK